jgi:hypothetical protein
MFKHNRALLPAIGAASLLATLLGAPAHAAGTGHGPGDSGNGGGAMTFGQPKHNAHSNAAPMMCREMTVDGGFETPKLGKGDDFMQFDADDVPGWRTDDPDGKIEIWGGSMGVAPRFGKQFAEINATGSYNSIYQDIKTKPNTKIYWSFWIRARDSSDGKDVDATSIHFGKTPKNDTSVNGIGGAFAYSNSADDVKWKRLYGWYMTGQGQTSTRVTLTADESASTDEGYGNLVDGLTIVDSPRCF